MSMSVGEAVSALMADDRRVKATEWRTSSTRLDAAGLYAWWVDEAGAETLRDGINETIQSGLIYVGQTGATRWPSGARSSQTLKGRIGSNHLGGSVRGSTFRRTLASTLAVPLSLRRATNGRRALEAPGEGTLTDWMMTHLSVSVWPCVDCDALGAIERAVLSELDPPMNIEGMSPSRLRHAIKTARAMMFG